MGRASHGLSTRLDRWQYAGTDPEAWEQGVPRTAHGVTSRAKRLKALGNSVVPQCAYEVGLRMLTIMAHLREQSTTSNFLVDRTEGAE